MQFFLIENRRTEFALRVLFQYNGVWENKIEYGHCVVSTSFFFFLKVFQPYRMLKNNDWTYLPVI